MSYVQILDHLDHQEQQEDLYKFRAITGHQGPLLPQDENYKGSKYNVMVEWETGEITDEPLSLIAADDPVTCAEYAKKHDLLHLDGWKRLKHIAKNQKQLTRAINQSKIRQVRRSAVYQFGFLIPKDYKQALQLDEQNGNSKWYDATKLEMDQINEYKAFQDHGKAQYDPKSRKVSNAPNGYQKIRVHLIFAVKHDGRHKARLVAGGHLTPDPIESIYSGVVSIRSLRLVIFLGSFPTTLGFRSFERNRTQFFSIRIPSTKFDFVGTNSKFNTVKVVMESRSYVVLSVHPYCSCVRH